METRKSVTPKGGNLEKEISIGVGRLHVVSVISSIFLPIWNFSFNIRRLVSSFFESAFFLDLFIIICGV